MKKKSTEQQFIQRDIDNSLKKLQLEYGGIRDTIRKYSSGGLVVNYLDQLQDAINKNDISAIKHCLSGLEDLFHKNLTKIQEDPFCFNKEDHIEAKMKIEEFCKIFANYDDIAIGNEPNINVTSSQGPIIFISHKSDDKKYGDALEKFITGLGVEKDQLIYTTHPLHKIPLDANIYEYLREHINRQIFMIILWSDKYLESPACLNEMGAAWVTQSDYTNLYVPTFSFDNPKYHECAVDTRKMCAVLKGDNHCKASMIELKNKIQSLFTLEENEQTTSYLLDEFQKEIRELMSNEQN